MKYSQRVLLLDPMGNALPDSSLLSAVPSDSETGAWALACLAADVFALQVKSGLRKTRPTMVVRASAGPVRSRWMKHLEDALQETAFVKLPIGIDDTRLLGGLDLPRSLQAGRKVEASGLLAEADGGIIVVPMAQLATGQMTAALAECIDSGYLSLEREGVSTFVPAQFGLILFDESDGDEQGIAPALMDRSMLHVDLTNISIRSLERASKFGFDQAANAVELNDEIIRQSVSLPLLFGLNSIRVAQQLTICASLVARLRNTSLVEIEDLETAVQLCVLCRAKILPEMPPPEPDDPPQEPDQAASQEEPNAADDQDETDTPPSSEQLPDELTVESVLANLPKDVLDLVLMRQKLAGRKNTSGKATGAENEAKRGRRLTSRRGEIRSGKPLDLTATLRAAVPWQSIRKRFDGQSDRTGIRVRPEDFHTKRFRKKSARSIIFVVDASGSTATNRLGEAKGAIELLLGKSYSARDYVALVSMRGRKAEVILPPTKALARAKRELSALKGGGGTPLADGLRLARQLAFEEIRQGRDPLVVIMTDGSANVNLEGKGGRKSAMADAIAAARLMLADHAKAVVIDVAKLPSDRSSRIAETMGAQYVPMPFASARNLSNAVSAIGACHT